MRRLLGALALLVTATSADAATSVDRPYPCYWVRGRLMAYNGTPTFRIWPRGTHRLLGVADGRPDAALKVLPQPVVQALGPHTFEKEVWGDFHVCPVSRERSNRMRIVHLADARVLATTDYGASRREAR